MTFYYVNSILDLLFFNFEVYQVFIEKIPKVQDDTSLGYSKPIFIDFVSYGCIRGVIKNNAPV